jgi:S1-C subfamily serine protease
LPVTATADGFSQALLEEQYNRIVPAMVLIGYSSEITNAQSGEISKRDSIGLGLIVSADGLIMTHGHMVLDNLQPFNIVVTVGEGADEQEYSATVLKKPDDLNVVFLRIESEETLNLPFVKFEKDATLKLGSPIAVFGMMSETFDYSKSFIESRIGAILEKPRKTYCLNSSIRFGYVNGPVINDLGQIIGVVGYDLSRGEGGDLYVRSGHPLLFQSELFQKYIDNPNVEDDSDVAYFGVFTQPLTDDFATYWGLEKKGGLIVSTVVPGSPAATAGFLSGDIITEFDGTPIKAKQDRDILGFSKLVRESGTGRSVAVKFLRGGEPMSIDVQLLARPRTKGDAQEFETESLGMTVREITRDVRIALNLAEDVQGVIVRRVKSGGAASLGRMRPGLIIMSLGDHAITNLDDFRLAVENINEQKPTELTVFVRAGTATGFLRIEPRWGTP